MRTNSLLRLIVLVGLAGCSPSGASSQSAPSQPSITTQTQGDEERRRCSETIPFEPTYLPARFDPDLVPGPAAGGRVADGKGQLIAHFRARDGRAIEVRRPATLFTELALGDDPVAIRVLGEETANFGPISPGGRDYIVSGAVARCYWRFVHHRDMAPSEDRLLEVVRTNPLVFEVLERAEALRLPDWYLTAGCLFQTVWNHLHEYSPQSGILDYDLFYCDMSDLSWEGEDAVIKRTAEVFAGTGASVQVRNQARVHLWFKDHFGIPIAPFTSSRGAIRNFLATACCLGIRTNDGDIDVYSPFGTDDLFELIVRRNPEAAGPQSAYEKKTKRWAQLWPRLTILPWGS